MMTLKSQEAPEKSQVRRYFAVIYATLIGLLGSLVLYITANNWEREHLQIEFESRAKAYANAIQTHLNSNVEALMFLRDFYYNSENVTRQEFSSFVKSVMPRYPGIQGFSWNPLVFDNERAAYESLAQTDGFEDFTFTERREGNGLVRASRRDEYVIVYYIEPLETNKTALGYDIASNPTRLKAIKKGFANGKLAATDRIILVQETGNQFGILLLLPIYKKGILAESIEERHRNRKGFVVEVLRIGNVIETALKDFPDEGIQISVFDLSAEKEKRFLHHSASKRSGPNESTLQLEPKQDGLHWSNTFDFAGRKWEIVCRPSSFYLDSRHLWQPWVILIGSLAFTFLLAFYLLRKLKYTTEIEDRINQEILTNEKLAKEISNRKQAEQTATSFGQILERSLNEIYVFNAETLKFIQVNDGARKNLGYSMAELQKLTPLDIKPEYTHDSFLNLLEPLRTGKESVANFNTIHRRKNKTVYPVEVHLQFVAQDSIPVFVAIILDITEKQKMEEQLKQSQKMEAIGTLAGGIAHDFNNILSVVIGYTELALNEAEKDSVLYQNLKEVFRASERARDMVKHILTFSRQTEQKHTPVHVKMICREVIKFLKASLPANIEIKQKISSDSLTMADPTQIHQLLMNLCTNAGHAMALKGGELEITLIDIHFGEDVLAEHPELKPGAYIEITVSDTGYGISPSIIDRIFDPFFTTKEKGEGTGMGLSVAHGIVGLYGGKIMVSSQIGKGSTFTVYLPIVEREKTPMIIGTESVPTGSERILFVDDETALVNFGKQMLESLGYQVTTRTSSLEALELFKAKPDSFDIVITDMTMPKMTGDELAKELIRVRPDIPVILCTGYSARIDEQQAAALGIKAFVTKPVLRADIAETIRKILDQI